MDRLEAMGLLLDAVEAGSLSEAGRRRSIPLATVSRKISDLETYLGATLLTRSSRRLSLTDAGRAYVEACKRILEDVNEAERIASGEYATPKGELTLTAPIAFGRDHILPLAIGFLQTYPDILLRFLQADTLANLVDEHIDLAVRIGELPDSRMVATRVGFIRRVVCASPEFLEKHGVPRTPADLASLDAVCRSGLTVPEGWIFKIDGADAYAPLRRRLDVNTSDAAIEAAAGGLGVTRLLSYQTAAAVRAGKLRIVLREFEPDPWPVNLVWPAQPMLPLKLRAFLDFMTPRLKERLRRVDEETRT